MKKKQGSILDKLIAVVLVVVAMIACTAWLNGWGPFAGPTQDDLSSRYELTEKTAKIVKIVGQPAVRSEPIVIGDDEHSSNSFGNAKKDSFTVEITKIYSTKESIDSRNGAFIGLSVEEVIATAEGKEWFPSKITSDPDGIVWINQKYITVIA